MNKIYFFFIFGGSLNPKYEQNILFFIFGGSWGALMSKQSDKDFLSYRENDEISADEADAMVADAAQQQLNHCTYIRTGIQ